MRHILITGTNRGIGQELVRQYAQQPQTHIFSAARQAVPAAANITPVLLEVTDADSITRAAAQVQAVTPKLDVLILNAGVNQPDEQDIANMTTDTLRHILEVNTIAPFALTQAFLPLLRAAGGAKIIYISSEMASIADRTYRGANAYCISKAGLNMLMRGTAAEFRSEDMIAIALDPGWVQTHMGGPQATLSPEDSVRGMIRLIDGLTLKDSGQFRRWDGGQNDW